MVVWNVQTYSPTETMNAALASGDRCRAGVPKHGQPTGCGHPKYRAEVTEPLHGITGEPLEMRYH